MKEGEIKLTGKVALVTGAGRGIGRAIALALAKEGADVAVNAAHLSSAEKTAEVIREIGRRTIAIEADVSKEDQVQEMIDRVINELGGVHILVNNAGVNPEIVPTLEQSLEKWDRIISVNLRGTYLCCHYAGEWMIAHKTGKIVNMSSMMGDKGIPMRTAYSPTKAGIVNMTQCLAVEWAKYNINVNCIAPGFIMTDLAKGLIKEGRIDVEAYTRRTPLGRLPTPEDVAKAVIFLVSDEARNITGVNLPIDGGWTAYGFL